MLGPVTGGLIVHYLHWSIVFFVNLPVGLLGLFFVWRFLPDYREDKTMRSTSSGWCCSAPASRSCPTCWRCSASTA